MDYSHRYYPTAIVPAEVNSNSLHSGNLDGRLLSAQMYIASQANKVPNPEKVLQQKAKSTEEESISSIYRMLSRAVQGLTLVGLVSSLEKQWKLKIDWSSLPDLLSFRSLIISQRVHDALKVVINDIITSACKSERSGLSAAANNALNLVTEQCYHFFSAGDWYTYMTSRKMEELRTKMASNITSLAPAGMSSASVEDIEELSIQALKVLLLSTKHW